MGIFGVGTYIKIWGYINGLGGVAVAIGLITAFCIHFIRTGPPSLIPVPALRFTSFGFILLLFSWQFWMLRYDPRSQIPSWQAAQDGYQLVEQIKKLPRPVYPPAASYMLDMAGLPTNYHISQYADISLGAHYNAKVKAIYEQYDFEVTNPLNSGYYQSAIMPNGDYYDAFFNEESGYVCQDFSEPILRSIDGATTFLKGICAKPIGSTP